MLSSPSHEIGTSIITRNVTRTRWHLIWRAIRRTQDHRQRNDRKLFKQGSHRYRESWKTGNSTKISSRSGNSREFDKTLRFPGKKQRNARMFTKNPAIYKPIVPERGVYAIALTIRQFSVISVKKCEFSLYHPIHRPVVVVQAEIRALLIETRKIGRTLIIYSIPAKPAPAILLFASVQLIELRPMNSSQNGDGGLQIICFLSYFPLLIRV